MLTLGVNGEALRRHENVPGGEGAEALRRFAQCYEPKQTGQFLNWYRTQSGEGVSDHVLLYLAVHTGRLDTKP